LSTVSTTYLTKGREVYEIVVVDEKVTVTATSTLASAAQHKRHLHRHQHHHRHAGPAWALRFVVCTKTFVGAAGSVYEFPV
jgi:hypothetical protein